VKLGLRRGKRLVDVLSSLVIYIYGWLVLVVVLSGCIIYICGWLGAGQPMGRKYIGPLARGASIHTSRQSQAHLQSGKFNLFQKSTVHCCHFYLLISFRFEYFDLV
jgi:hypothetical protein